MENAKKQAKNIVDELKKTGKRAGEAFVERAIIGVLRYVVFGVIFLIIIKICQK
jgi:hypothetical protein